MGKRNRERRRDEQRRRTSGGPSGWPAGNQRGRSGADSAEGPKRPAEDAVTVRVAVLAAADAFRAGNEAAYARHLAVLGLEGGSLRTHQHGVLVGQVIEQVADQALAAAWERGWQPADVERLVRRRLRAGHADAVVAAIAHQHCRYAAATVGPGWRTQLRAMGADPWGPTTAPEERPGALPLEDLDDPGRVGTIRR